ncbi:hypothetical protein ACWEP2_37145, partial [Streptomyces sp. NPDC004279]
VLLLGFTFAIQSYDKELASPTGAPPAQILLDSASCAAVHRAGGPTTVKWGSGERRSARRWVPTGSIPASGSGTGRDGHHG